MSPGLAALAYGVLVLLLFWLDRDRERGASACLWLPIIWFALAGSRSVNQWLHLSAPVDSVDQVLEGNPIDRWVYSGLVFLGLGILAGRMRQLSRLLAANLPIVLFFLYAAMSLVWSDYPEVALKRWTKAAGDLVMVLIVLTEAEPFIATKKLLSRTTFLLIPASILLIKYYPEFGRGYLRWVWTPVYTGVTTNKNALGMICLLFGLASAWRIQTEYFCRDRRRQAGVLIAHAVCLAMVLWLLWICDSMTSLACFIVGIALLSVTGLRTVYRRPPVIHATILAVIVLAFAVLFMGVGADLVHDTARRDTSTLTERTFIWRLALSLVSNPPLGAGFESFWLGDRLSRMWAYNRTIAQAHNGYLEVYLNLGIIGVAILLVVLTAGYRRVIAAVHQRHALGALACVYLSVAIIYNFTEAAFRMMTPVWLVMLLAIIVTSPTLRSLQDRLSGELTVTEEGTTDQSQVDVVTLGP